MIPFGVRLNTLLTAEDIFEFSILDVPKVSTDIEVGSATPIA